VAYCGTDNEVYYMMNDGGAWTTPVNISNEPQLSQNSISMRGPRNRSAHRLAGPYVGPGAYYRRFDGVTWGGR